MLVSPLRLQFKSGYIRNLLMWGLGIGPWAFAVASCVRGRNGGGCGLWMGDGWFSCCLWLLFTLSGGRYSKTGFKYVFGVNESFTFDLAPQASAASIGVDSLNAVLTGLAVLIDVAAL
ncbi:hypothetical protein Tco_0691537 [Tanacetum coccineum]